MSVIEVMAARTDQITSAGTYGGATATGFAALLTWLSDNQGGLTVLVMVLTGLVTLVSGLYGIYYKRQILRIARTKGIDALRKSDQL